MVKPSALHVVLHAGVTSGQIQMFTGPVWFDLSFESVSWEH